LRSARTPYVSGSAAESFASQGGYDSTGYSAPDGKNNSTLMMPNIPRRRLALRARANRRNQSAAIASDVRKTVAAAAATLDAPAIDSGVITRIAARTSPPAIDATTAPASTCPATSVPVVIGVTR
jgi:hypothetical protein